MTAEPPAVTKPRRTQRQVPSLRRERELGWLTSHRDELINMAGEWVVIEGSALVAHGADYVRVVAEARSLGVRIPFAIRVPEAQSGVVMMGL